MVAEYDQYIDGHFYKKGETIADLGSFVVVHTEEGRRDYVGLAADAEKLPKYVADGSSALCLDTGDMYFFLVSTQTWYKL